MLKRQIIGDRTDDEIVQPLLKELDHNPDKNILVSTEAMARHWTRSREALQTMLRVLGKKYDVVVIAGYRYVERLKLRL